MKTQTFLYKGPDSGATLSIAQADGSSKDHEVMLFRGKPVNLPVSHAYTEVLLAQGLIESFSEEPATAPAPVASKPQPANKPKE